MSTISTTSETAIWARIIESNQLIHPEAARYLLTLAFPQKDQDRMHDLAVRNQQGSLTSDEVDELRNFRQIAVQVDLLRSKARLALRTLPQAG